MSPVSGPAVGRTGPHARVGDAHNPPERRIPMSDLAAMVDAHVQAEFQDRDLEATMGTMTDDEPYVHHVPTITGGNGTAGVRDFYCHHFVGQWPDDTRTEPISRTVGPDQVVDELLMTFTHDPLVD